MTYRQLLALYTDFRRLWIGQVVSEIGDWLNNIAVFALVIELAGRGHEGLAVALYGIARHVPLFLFGPLAGVVTDRVSRRRLMIAADIARAVLTFGFFAADARRSLPLIYLVGACLFAISTFFNAAKRASLPALVSDAGALLVANSLSASTTAATIAIGSALGGMVATLAGRSVVFTLNIVTFICSAFFIYRIKTSLDARQPGTTSSANETARSINETPNDEMRIREVSGTPQQRRTFTRQSGSGWQAGISWQSLARRSYRDFREGLAYVRAESVLASIFVVAAGWGLGNGAARALYTLFGARLGEAEARLMQVGRKEDFGISVLFVAMGLGGVAGAPLARRFNQSGESSLGDRMGRTLVFDGCLLALFSVMPNLWAAAIALILREMCFAVWWTAQQTIIMRRTKSIYAGRVFASFETLTTLAMVSSMLISGAAADLYGMRPIALLGGLTVALSGALWFILRTGGRNPDPISASSTTSRVCEESSTLR